MLNILSSFIISEFKLKECLFLVSYLGVKLPQHFVVQLQLAVNLTSNEIIVAVQATVAILVMNSYF